MIAGKLPPCHRLKNELLRAQNQTRRGPMRILNIQEAKTHLSRLVEEAVAGGDVIISKAGKPLVRLVSVGASTGPRPLGLLAGKVTETADCWDADSDTDALLYGSEPETELRVAERPAKP